MKNIEAFYPLQIGEDNKILRTKSNEIKEINDEIKEFAKILSHLMWKYDGVGLAAPQIGENIQMIAITTRKETKKWRKNIDEIVMINPTIKEKSINTWVDLEACLSLLEIEWDVRRHQEITVEYTTLKGQKTKQQFKWFTASIMQHEIDHLHGILFIDKLEKKEKLLKNKEK